MKKISIILVMLLWCNVGFAMTEQEAMSQLSKKYLDPIEGIWAVK